MNFTMPNGMLKHALRFYNFSCILFLKVEDSAYKVSSFQTFFNIFKLLVLFGVTILISTQLTIRDEIFKKIIIDMSEYSKFAKFSSHFVIAIVYSSLYSLCFLQFYHRQKVKDLMNMIFLINIENGETMKKFRRNCVNDSIAFGIFFSFIYLVQFFSLAKLNFLSILISAVLCYATVIFFGFLSFVKSFENFLVASIKDLKYCVNHSSMIQGNRNVKEVVKLSKKYLKIFYLVEKFNKCFGLQVMLYTCYSTSMIVFGVIEFN